MRIVVDAKLVGDSQEQRVGFRYGLVCGQLLDQHIGLQRRAKDITPTLERYLTDNYNEAAR